MSLRFRKTARDLWNLLVCHIPSRSLRNAWLKRLLAEFGDAAFVALHVEIKDPAGVRLAPRSVVMSHCILDGRGAALTIGCDVAISDGAHIWTLDHDANSPDFGVRGRAVTIGDHSWIASRATVLPGVTVGRGAVVAAGAVVTRDVAPLSIVAGIPARSVAQRRCTLEYKFHYHPRFR